MAGATWTVRSILSWSRDWLARKGVEAPRLDAELLLARALSCDRLRLYVDHDKPLAPEELSRFKELLRRREAREPVAYILGEKEFYGRTFAVDRRTFIPRPESELLVQAALQALPKEDGRALDLCAGSGCVGLSLAAERPGLQVDLVELSPEAAEVARANAERHAPARANVFVGDLYEPLPPDARYGAIVSNPPYVPQGDAGRLPPDISRHEPRLALFGGEDGLAVIRRIVAGARLRLSQGGWLLLEIDPPEGPEVVALCRAAGLDEAKVGQDLAGLDRMVCARASGV